MSNVKSCLLVGVGGQGAILISKIMSNGFMKAGYDQGQVRRFTDYKKTRCQQAACLFSVWCGMGF